MADDRWIGAPASLQRSRLASSAELELRQQAMRTSSTPRECSRAAHSAGRDRCAPFVALAANTTRRLVIAKSCCVRRCARDRAEHVLRRASRRRGRDVTPLLFYESNHEARSRRRPPSGGQRRRLRRETATRHTAARHRSRWEPSYRPRRPSSALPGVSRRAPTPLPRKEDRLVPTIAFTIWALLERTPPYGRPRDRPERALDAAGDDWIRCTQQCCCSEILVRREPLVVRW